MIDPHPRSYPDLTTLLRRSDRGTGCAPAGTTTGEIHSWLLSGALQDRDILPLVESLAWRMVTAGIPLERVTVHVGTLHPQLLGFYWHWEQGDGLIDELKVDRSGYDTDRYRKSLLARVIETGDEFRSRTDDREALDRYPLLTDLRQQGIRDYAVIPLGAGGAYHNAITVSTQRESGFDEADMSQMREIFRIFALHMERHMLALISENVVDTYLGHMAGRKVLSGSIGRGAGESIRAVIWISDLRGFTGLVDRMAAEDVLAVLNEYFEKIAEAVITNGGEILKFIGDGLLAVFPISEKNDEQHAAELSLLAAEQALENVKSLVEAPPESIRNLEGWKPLHSGIALHLGEVFFGNVGAPERLDFTVIGKAVNEASRVESLTRELGRQVLITETVARLLDCDLDNLGSYDLRGLSGKMIIYSIPTR